MAFARFDGAAVWAALTPEQQAAIGAAVLEWAAGFNAVDAEASGRFPTPIGRAAQEGLSVATDRLIEEIADATSREVWRAEDGQVRLPSCLGMVCRACGCSEDDPCPEGCAWASEDLCTACAKEMGAIDGVRSLAARNAASLERQCEAFNLLHPVGSRVRAWPGVFREGRFIDCEVREPGAYVLSGHTAVVFVTGYGSCVALSHIEGRD